LSSTVPIANIGFRLIQWDPEDKGGILRLLSRSEDWGGILLLFIFSFSWHFFCALPCLVHVVVASQYLSGGSFSRLTAFYAMFLYLVHYWVANFTDMLRKWEALSVP
jgi:hypothetical protein